MDQLRRRTGNDQRLYYIGYAQLKLGDYVAAEESLRLAVEVLPQSWEALLGLARALYHRAKHDEAAARFEAVLRLQPNNVEALFHLGLLERVAGRQEAALPRFEQVVSIRPFHAGALYNAAQAALRLGRMELARDYLSRHRELVPKLDRIESLRKAASFPSSTAYNWLSLGNAHLEVGQYDEALGAFEKAAAKDPGLDVVHYHLGFAAYRAGDYSRAAASYLRFLAGRPDHFETLFNLGHALRKGGLLEEAAEVFEKASRANPTQPLPRVALAEMEIEREDWSAAVRTTSELTAAFPDYPRGFFLNALSLFRSGRPEAALGPAKRAVELETGRKTEDGKGKAEFHALLGEVFQALGQTENARREFELAKKP